MPNHITNKLEFIGNNEDVQSLVEKYSTFYERTERRTHDGQLVFKNSEDSYGWYNEDNKKFSKRTQGVGLEYFDNIPEGYEKEYIEAYTHFPDFNKIKPQPKNIYSGDLGAEEKKMCKEKGVPNWYDWNIENWGTKWNCYEFEKINSDTYLFDTAWSGVTELILEMSRKNPNVKIIYKYADEDTGSNTGSYVIMKGEIIEDFSPENGTKEAYDLASEVSPERGEHYVCIEDEYVFIDDLDLAKK